MKRKAEAKGKVVYAIKDIPEGQTIPTEGLEERELEQAKIPQDAITSASLAAGRIAKYGIAFGTNRGTTRLGTARDDAWL